jgi:hypothetical protein
LGLAELGLHRTERHDPVGAWPGAVEVPPARAVRDKDEVATRIPPGLEDGLLRGAGDVAEIGERVVGGDIGLPQLGAIPWHEGMVPGEEGEQTAVGGEGRGGDEVRPGDDHHAAILVGSVEIEHDDGVDRLGILEPVILPHSDDPVVVRIDQHIGIAKTGVGRRDRTQVPVVGSTNLIMRVVAYDDETVAGVPDASAVLMDARADVAV